MSYTTLQKALDLASTGVGPLHIQLTGGEPSLVEDLVHFAVRKARLIKRTHTIGIQSNGTCLSASLVQFLKKQQVQICISLDGPPDVHQQLRGNAVNTLQGLQLLELCEAPFRVTTVLSEQNIHYLSRLVLMLSGFGQARGIGLDLLVNKGSTLTNNLQPPIPNDLMKEIVAMVSVLDSVNIKRKIPLQLRELELLKDAQLRTVEERPFCHACRGESLAVAPTGELSICGQKLIDDIYCAGRIDSPQWDRLKGFEQHILKTAMCDNCPLQGRCPGECPSRMHYNGTDNPALICSLYLGLLSTLNSKMS